MHGTMDHLPALATPTEVARFCRVSLRTVRRWREMQLLSPLVSPWRPRYAREEVIAIIEALGSVRAG